MKMGDVRQENYTIKGFLPSRRKGPAAAGSRCFFRPDGGRAMLRHGKKRRRGIEFYKALWWNKVQSPKVFSVPFGYGAGRREKAWRRSQRKVPPCRDRAKLLISGGGIKHMKKRLMASILTVVMILTMLPVSALADNADTEPVEGAVTAHQRRCFPGLSGRQDRGILPYRKRADRRSHCHHRAAAAHRIRRDL